MYNANSHHFRFPNGFRVIWNNRSTLAESTTVTSSINGKHLHNIDTSHLHGHDFAGKQEVFMKKIASQHAPEGRNYTHDSVSLGVLNLEEMIMYFLLLLLLIYVFTHIVKCVRITLDPYSKGCLDGNIRKT